MRYTITTKTYKCPRCGSVVKVKQDNEMMGCLAVLFFPVTLLYFLIKWIVKKGENYTVLGEQIKTCKGCGAKVVIGELGTHLLKNEEIKSTYNNTASVVPVVSKTSDSATLQTKTTEKGTQIVLEGYGYDKNNPIKLAGVHYEYQYLPSLVCQRQGYMVSSYDRNGSISAGNKMLDLWTVYLSKSGSSVKYYVEIYIDAYAMFNDTSTAPKGFSIRGTRQGVSAAVDDTAGFDSGDDNIDTSSNRKY